MRGIYRAVIDDLARPLRCLFSGIHSLIYNKYIFSKKTDCPSQAACCLFTNRNGSAELVYFVFNVNQVS